MPFISIEPLKKDKNGLGKRALIQPTGDIKGALHSLQRGLRSFKFSSPSTTNYVNPPSIESSTPSIFCQPLLCFCLFVYLLKIN